MSLNGGRFGGQYRSPLTTKDWAKIWIVVAIAAAVFFGPLIGAVKWWTFG